MPHNGNSRKPAVPRALAVLTVMVMWGLWLLRTALLHGAWVFWLWIGITVLTQLAWPHTLGDLVLWLFRLGVGVAVVGITVWCLGVWVWWGLRRNRR